MPKHLRGRGVLPGTRMLFEQLCEIRRHTFWCLRPQGMHHPCTSPPSKQHGGTKVFQTQALLHALTQPFAYGGRFQTRGAIRLCPTHDCRAIHQRQRLAL